MRIIAGLARGHRIDAPATGTRPTSDRVREALFSTVDSLAGSWSGTRVLDLYAGSGALGLEALSRGARSAVLVERDRRAASVMRANVERTGLAEAHVLVADAAATGLHQRIPADLRPVDRILVDPPYEVPAERVRTLLRGLVDAGCVAPGAWAVVERAARDDESPLPEEGWDEVARRTYGDTALWYGRRT